MATGQQKHFTPTRFPPEAGRHQDAACTRGDYSRRLSQYNPSADENDASSDVVGTSSATDDLDFLEKFRLSVKNRATRRIETRKKLSGCCSARKILLGEFELASIGAAKEQPLFARI